MNQDQSTGFAVVTGAPSADLRSFEGVEELHGAIRSTNQGRILFTASIAAEAPGPFEAVYAASQAFVLSFAEAIRNELKDTGIVITALQPGATETNFHRAGTDDTKVATSRKSDPAEVARRSFEALMHGKDHVVAAIAKEEAQVAMSHVSPGTASAEVHRKLAEPGSAEN